MSTKWDEVTADKGATRRAIERRRKIRASIALTLVGIILTILLFYTAIIGHVAVFWHERIVYIRYARVVPLAVDNDVRIQGVKVGKVRGMTVIGGGPYKGQALIRVGIINPDATLYKSAVFYTQSTSLLGLNEVQIEENDPASGPIDEEAIATPDGAIQGSIRKGMGAIITEISESEDYRILSENIDTFKITDGAVVTKFVDEGGKEIDFTVFEENFKGIGDNLSKVSDHLKESRGSISRLMKNPRDFQYNIEQAQKSINSITRKLRTSRGLLGAIFADRYLSYELDQIQRELAVLSRAIGKGDGPIGRIMSQETTERLDNVVEDFKTLGEAWKKKRGSLARFAAGSEFTEGFQDALGGYIYDKDITEQDPISTVAGSLLGLFGFEGFFESSGGTRISDALLDKLD